MTAKITALAAALLATTSFCTLAEAGGIRLGMGGPLGSFTAHPYHSSGPGGSGAERHSSPHCQPHVVARSYHHEEAAVHHVRRPAPKIEVAEEEPAPRKVRRPAPKIEVQDDAPPVTVAKAKPVKVDPQPEVKTAKLEDKTTITDTAPAIFIPDSPAEKAKYSGTQSTPAPAKTAALGPTTSTYTAAIDTPAVKAEPLKSEAVVKPAEAVKPVKVEKTAKTGSDETKKAESTSSMTKICRKFSAAIAGLITVPCGE